MASRPRALIAVLTVMLPSAAPVAAPASSEVVRTPFDVAWRLHDDDPRYLVGVPVAALADPDKNVYILDGQLATIWVFDSNGRFLRSIGEPGEGPGGLGRKPVALAWTSDSELVVLERSPLRLHTFDVSGAHRSTTTFEGGQGTLVGLSLRAWAQHMVVKVSELLRHPRRNSAVLALTTLSADRAGFAHTLATQTHRNRWDRFEFNEVDDHFAVAWAAGDHGRTYAARSFDRYAITVYTGEGEIERVIQEPYAHLRRPEDEVRRLQAERTPMSCPDCPTVNIEISPFEPDIVDLRVSASGALHVLSSRGAHDPPPGVFQRWDVFDVATGDSVRHVDVVLPGDLATDSREDRTFWLSDDLALICRRWRDMAWTTLGGAATPTSIACVADALEVVCVRSRAPR